MTYFGGGGGRRSKVRQTTAVKFRAQQGQRKGNEGVELVRGQCGRMVLKDLCAFRLCGSSVVLWNCLQASDGLVVAS